MTNRKKNRKKRGKSESPSDRLRRAWRTRRKLYRPSGFKDLEAYKQKLRHYMVDGGAKCLVEITRRRYGYCRCRNPALKRKRQQKSLGIINRLPEQRRANRAGLLRHWANPEEYKKHYAAIIAPEVQERNAQNVKAYYANMSKQEKDELREKRRIFFQAMWDNYTPEQKEARIRKSVLGHHIRPNKLEQRIIYICKDHNLPVKYHGDRPYPGLHYKMPDFVSNNGDKKIIELFGDYWHDPEEEQERIDFFGQHGFKCLVMWEREISEMSDLEIADRISTFLEDDVNKSTVWEVTNP